MGWYLEPSSMRAGKKLWGFNAPYYFDLKLVLTN